MKKIFFALAALVLAFTGCSQEEDAIQVSEKKAIKVVVNMDKPGFGEDTRAAAARTGWVNGDQVIGTIGSPGIGILLTYNSGSWTTKFLKVAGAKYVEASSADLDAMLEDGGDVMAAYFSSKIIENSLEFEVSPTTSLPTMVIKTNASSASTKMGECVMTCENGTCEVEKTASEYLLTLNITMIPQVAQYTIRDLNIVENGCKISIDGPVNGYAGGKITPAGVDLTLIEDVLYGYLHQNGNDISIFAAPWQSSADIPDGYFPPSYVITSESYKAPYVFTVHDEDTYWFEREFDYKAVENGDAVIMDGPYTDGAEGWE